MTKWGGVIPLLTRGGISVAWSMATMPRLSFLLPLSLGLSHPDGQRHSSARFCLQWHRGSVMLRHLTSL
jgi:hypothetical protein